MISHVLTRKRHVVGPPMLQVGHLVDDLQGRVISRVVRRARLHVLPCEEPGLSTRPKQTEVCPDTRIPEGIGLTVIRWGRGSALPCFPSAPPLLAPENTVEDSHRSASLGTLASHVPPVNGRPTLHYELGNNPPTPSKPGLSKNAHASRGDSTSSYSEIDSARLREPCCSD